MTQDPLLKKALLRQEVIQIFSWSFISCSHSTYKLHEVGQIPADESVSMNKAPVESEMNIPATRCVVSL